MTSSSKTKRSNVLQSAFRRVAEADGDIAQIFPRDDPLDERALVPKPSPSPNFAISNEGRHRPCARAISIAAEPSSIGLHQRAHLLVVVASTLFLKSVIRRSIEISECEDALAGPSVAGPSQGRAID
jgi:hypothetical protein